MYFNTSVAQGFRTKPLRRRAPLEFSAITILLSQVGHPSTLSQHPGTGIFVSQVVRANQGPRANTDLITAKALRIPPLPRRSPCLASPFYCRCSCLQASPSPKNWCVYHVTTGGNFQLGKCSDFLRRQPQTFQKCGHEDRPEYLTPHP